MKASPKLGASIAQVRLKPPPPFHDLWQPGALGDPKYRERHMMLSTTWTNWPLITVGLVQRGYSDDEVRKVIGENTLRVWRGIHRSTVPVF